MRGIISAFARNRVFANILLILIVFAGMLAARLMVRETFPDFSLEIITVTVPWPGADPEEVEEGICIKLEQAILGIPGIRQYNTIAAEDMGTLVVQLQDDYDMMFVKDRVRNAVDAISTFPPDAERPITEEMLLRTEVIMLSLYGDHLTERQLKEWAQLIREDILALPGVSQTEVLAARPYEISIEVSEERLREYGLTFSDIVGVVRANSYNFPGGVMRTAGEEIRLRTLGRNYTGADFANIIALARPDGETITLDRIADIHDDFDEDALFSRFNGHRCVTVMVQKTSEEDTLAIDRVVREYIVEKQAVLPDGVYIEPWGGFTDILESRLRLLTRNGTIGIMIVFALLWLFLDIRLSFWAGMGLPISIAGALAVMWLVGATLNMISLFGLIMVIGIIVDDAIVVGEAIYVARKNGAPQLQAAVDGVMEVGMPVIAAVVTSIVAFAPLLFVGGIMGKFIFQLPVVVIACLTISLVECLILLPAHLNHLPHPDQPLRGRNRAARFGRAFHYRVNAALEAFVARVYTPALMLAIRWRYITLCVAIALMIVMGGIVGGGMVRFQLFQDLDSDVLTARIEFPNGTPLDVTEAAVAHLEQAMEAVAADTPSVTGEPLLKNIYSLVGSEIDPYGTARGSHVGGVRVEIVSSEHRDATSFDLMAAWEREVGTVPGVIALTIEGMRTGPPGAPIELWLRGRNLDEMLEAAEQVQRKLATYEAVYQIQQDFRPGQNEFRLRLKPEARTLGLTVADLGGQLFAGYFGEEAVRIQRGRDDVRVRVRYPLEERRSLDEFDRVRIRTPRGLEVPLRSVADIEYGPGVSVINRTDGLRRVMVSAEVLAHGNARQITNDMEAAFLPELREAYPDILFSFEGEQRNAAESLNSLAILYPLALLAIYAIIATMFRTYLQPFVILVTVPFGIIGAVVGHLLLGYDLTMMSMFGMVALSGVVVNDAIVYIECVNNYLKQEMGFADALRAAGVRRFRPILLTSLSTIGGLTPMLLERDVQAQFLIPMAISIAAGVAFATALTLILVPSLMHVVNDLRLFVRWWRVGIWSKPECVEPAYVMAYEQERDQLKVPGAIEELIKRLKE